LPRERQRTLADSPRLLAETSTLRSVSGGVAKERNLPEDSSLRLHYLQESSPIGRSAVHHRDSIGVLVGSENDPGRRKSGGQKEHDPQHGRAHGEGMRNLLVVHDRHRSLDPK